MTEAAGVGGGGVRSAQPRTVGFPLFKPMGHRGHLAVGLGSPVLAGSVLMAVTWAAVRFYRMEPKDPDPHYGGELRPIQVPAARSRSDEFSGGRSSWLVTNAGGGAHMSSKPFTTCLWFDTQAEEAADFYVSIFKNSKIGRIFRYNAAGPGPEGTVATIEFELNGQKFVGLNGGPQYTFSPAISLVVECADQAEIDYYWQRLLDGGGQEVACGWLTDKYGLSWQVVASEFLDMIPGPDAEAATRATAAMLQMKKFDIAALRKACAGQAWSLP
jgi:predicted 3-demethylubiquinone-9 3-methyltransferase (glyoxalase superfamily)